MADAPPPYPGTSTQYTAQPGHTVTDQLQGNTAPYPPLPPQQPGYQTQQQPPQPPAAAAAAGYGATDANYQTKQGLYPQENVNPGPTVVVPSQTVMTAQPQNTTVIVTAPAVRTTVYRPFPVQIDCPSCHQRVVTTVNYHTGGLSWLLFGAICLTGLWCGCCLIPFVVDGCKDAHHACPNCKIPLGVYHRL